MKKITLALFGYFIAVTCFSQAIYVNSSGDVGIGTSSPAQLLDIRGNTIFNENYLYLKDANAGLVYSNTWGGATMDGPAIFGYSGGVLGSTNGGNKVILLWNNSGNVGINTSTPLQNLD